jgi:hypothetical protein
MIYVDKVHMVADSIEELHSFAETIGLKRHFFEGVRKGHPHYDLTNKIIMAKAIENGATIVGSKKIVEISHKLALEKTNK